jgi:hypothetical protein
LNTADNLLSGWVDDLKGLAVNGLYKLIVDEAGWLVSTALQRDYKASEKHRKLGI